MDSTPGHRPRVSERRPGLPTPCPWGSSRPARRRTPANLLQPFTENLFKVLSRSAQDPVTISQTGDLKQETGISHSSAGWESEIREQRGWVLWRALLGLQTDACSLGPHVEETGETASSLVSPPIRALIPSQRPHLLTST